MPIKTTTFLKKTAAYLKIDQYRDVMNNDRQKIEAPDLSSVAYFYTNPRGKATAIAYRGRSKKSAFHFCYNSPEIRAAKVAEWMDTISSNKTKYARKPRELIVDDILSCSWGYEQTNIDYYKVLALKGKTQVIIIEIGEVRNYTGDMQGTCVPDPDTLKGDPMTKTVDGSSINISSFQHASKITPTLVNGVKTYDAAHWTSYH